MELNTKDQELSAAETRLSNMEKDLVELSATNENYRSQVCQQERSEPIFFPWIFTELVKKSL